MDGSPILPSPQEGQGSETEPSPPSSPIVGYPNISSSTGNLSELEPEPAPAFRCKGPPKDPHFHPESLILRKQLIAVLQPLFSLLEATDRNGEGGKCAADSSSSPLSGPQLEATFGHFSVNVSDPAGLQVAVSLARKNAHILQLAAEDRGPPEFGERYTPKCVQLREEVIGFLGKVRTLDGLDPTIFSGYLEALSWRNWSSSSSSSLRVYQPPRESRGSVTNNSVFQYFHLLLDLKWGLLSASFIASREKGEGLLSWVVQDLLAMAQEFWRGKGEVWNCTCVKELWTLLRLFCEEMGLNFWGILANSLLLSPEKEDRDQGFVYLLVGELATLSDYNMCGLYSPGKELTEPFKYNGYFLVKELLKQAEKPALLYPLTSQLCERWGPDLDLLQTLWQDWTGKLDKRSGKKDLNLTSGQIDYSASVEKWGQLVTILGSGDKDPLLESWTKRDDFLGFLRVLAQQGRRLKGKEWRKLKSLLGMNLNKSTLSTLGELGLVRIATMYLTLAVCCDDMMALCDRLSELLQHSVKSSKICLRAKAVGIQILLRKQTSLANSDLQASFMTTITMTMAQSPLDSVKKEAVMIYLELLDALPKGTKFQVSSNSNLGRETLISPNMTMWLSSCGPNHSVRTLRSLRNLTDWVLSQWDCKTKCEEAFLLIGKIFERTTQFLMQAAVLQTNRCPKTDIEPMASLASSLTVFSKWNQNQQTSTLDALKLFDHFALNERTSPEISLYYVTHLLSLQDECLLEGLPDLKWFQAWIRLNVLDLSIPEALNGKVIGPFSSTSSLELLKKFCLRSDEMSRGDLANIISPLVPLVKGTCSGSIFKGENATEPWTGAVIKGITKLLKHLEFEHIYAKGDPTSLAGQLFTALLPPLMGTPPWEKLPKLVISSFKENYYDIFLTLSSSQNFGNDPFLLRKVQDLFNLAVLAFLDEEMGDAHPLVQILIYAENKDLDVITGKGVSVVLKLAKEDPKLWARLVLAAYYLRRMGLLTSCARFLPGVLGAYINLDDSKVRTQAVSVMSYVMAVGKEPSFRENLEASFQHEMSNDFWKKPKRFYDLAKDVMSIPQKNVKITLRDVLLPLYKRHVELAESRRGTVNDQSLRDPLCQLEKALAS